MSEPFLYLASASPRRHQILQQLGIPHHVLRIPDPDGDDEPQLDNESPDRYVIRTACEKAMRAVHYVEHPDHRDIDSYVTAIYSGHEEPDRSTTGDRPDPEAIYILSADTTVILNNQVLGKPRDKDDAATMLRSLSGTTHHVHTAVALSHKGQLSQAVSISEVTFKKLSEAEIDIYCASGEPMGKAGSYGIQGRAAAFVSHLAGSYSGVMGLPAYETTTLLEERGFFRFPK